MTESVARLRPADVGPARATRPRQTSRVLAGLLAGLVLLLTGTVVAEAVLGHQRLASGTGVALTAMLWVIAAVGLVVAWHQPGNAIGWLMLAALFTPLRRRVQHIVDRRFNRARYDAHAAVEAFATRLAGAVALAEVRADLHAVIGGTLQPAHLAVWVGEGER